MERAGRTTDRGHDRRPAAAAKAPRPNGLPPALKAGVEALSGLSLDHVEVHRNSAKPAALMAHAFAQDDRIHLGPGQDHHLPHEAWHVVQQLQGRVPATRRMAGTAINDDAGLEREADHMGGRALQMKAVAGPTLPGQHHGVAQMNFVWDSIKNFFSRKNDATLPYRVKAKLATNKVKHSAMEMVQPGGYSILPPTEEEVTNRIHNRDQLDRQQLEEHPVRTVAANAIGGAVSHAVGLGGTALNGIVPGLGSAASFVAGKGIDHVTEMALDKIAPVHAYKKLGSDEERAQHMQNN